MMMNENMSMVSEEPRVAELIQLFESCGPMHQGWDRLRDNDRTRLMVWDGQSCDGKKWDKNLDTNKAFPWDGASDVRMPVADTIVNGLKELLAEAFWRSTAKVSAQTATKLDAAGRAQKALSWLKEMKLLEALRSEVSLSADWLQCYGAVVLQVGWDREISYKQRKVTLLDLLSWVQEAARTGTGHEDATLENVEYLLTIIGDPTRDEESVKLLKPIYHDLVQSQVPEKWGYTVPECSTAKVRRMVRELREKGVTRVGYPYVQCDQPSIKARKLWEDIFIPATTPANIQEAPAIFVKEYFSEADFRAAAELWDWDRDWVEAAVKMKGKYSGWTTNLGSDASLVALSPELVAINGLEADQIEVLWCYQKRVDEDGIPAIWQTLVHPAVTKLAGAHEVLDYEHGLYPFVGMRREEVSRQFGAARGVPQIVATWQRAVKVQFDGVTDLTSLAVLPPILVPALQGVDYVFGPAVQVPVQSGKEPRVMDLMGRGTGVAFEVLDRLEKLSDVYFGRTRPDTDPDEARTKKQNQVRAFLAGWTLAFRQVFALMAQYMDKEQFMRVTGSQEPMPDDLTSVVEAGNQTLTFNVDDLNNEAVGKKLEAIATQVLPMDAAGVIDRVKLVEAIMRAIDPDLAEALVSDQAGASQALFHQVEDDLAKLSLGFQPEFTENDPTAPTQIRFASQLFNSNQRLQMLMASDKGFQERMMKWVENRKFSITQQQNKQIGRIGVDPSAAQEVAA